MPTLRRWILASCLPISLAVSSSADAGPAPRIKDGTGPLTGPSLPPTALVPTLPAPSPSPSPDPGSVKEVPIRGFADLHTHPMAHLGFGRKALHGAPDVGILVPAGTTQGCGTGEVRARSMADAFGNCNATHGGWGAGDNPCGDHLRAFIINDALDSHFWHIVGHERNLHNDHPHAGYPDFKYWPHHSSILHQQMWWEWVKRAHQGGLRVLVALTVHSETLAQVLNGDRPWDDKTVADLQIDETRRFVSQHPDFMEIALSAEHAERIIRSNRIAVILGMEVDRLGNFGANGRVPDEAAVVREIRRLYNDKQIRYAFPIHLIDNAFGGSAVYKMLMNMANRHQNGSLFSVMHSADPNVNYQAHFVSSEPVLDTLASAGFYALLEIFGHLPAPCGEFWKGCAPFTVGCCGNYQEIKRILTPTSGFEPYKQIAPGHVNARGLTRLGEVAVREMMRLGMIVDVDHMSELALRRTVEVAESVRGGYPLVMGHNGIRGPLPGRTRDADYHGDERAAPEDVVRRIGALGGMMGTGTAGTNAADFVVNYRRTRDVLVGGARPSGARTGLGLGTDANGFEPLPHRGPGGRFSADKTAFVPGDAWNHPPAQLACRASEGLIEVRSARIGCLDIQRDGNLTPYVRVACSGRRTCAYQAPSQAQYRNLGVAAATRDHCTQAMEVVYRCVARPSDPVTSASFYASFFRESGITTKQRKPEGRGEWDYIQEAGVSHYGLLPEFLHEVKQNDARVFEDVMSSADAFVQMWKKIDRVKADVGTGPVEGTFTQAFSPIGGQCPSERVAGDAEFGGHGPRVSGEVRLAVTPSGDNIAATITFAARETTADWSEVRGTFTVNVADPAPRGMRYAGLEGPTRGTFDQVLSGGGRNEVFEGCDGGQHEVLVREAGAPRGRTPRIIARMVVVGDTGGADISGDRDCNCDTRIVSVALEPGRVTLRRR